MQNSDLSLIWLIGGILLMVAEFIIPGGIIFFLGLGATIVALLLYAGLLDGWLQALTAWFIGSLILLFGLRGLVQKIVPAEVTQGTTDEDLDAYNQPADVCERIPAGGEGRIHFHGSTWIARSHDTHRDLEIGTRVRIVFRDNLIWIVEPMDDSSSDPL